MIALGAALAGCTAPPPPAPPARQASEAIDWDATQTISVALTDFAFTPDRLALRAGTPIRLILANNGSGTHDFSAPAFFAAAAYRPGSTAPPAGRVALAKGGRAEIDLVPETAGRYPLECTEFLHSSFGMTGQIDVAAGP